MITHLACIMDGNRRWAKQKGWRAWIGHQHGVDAAARTVRFCLQNNIAYLSLYLFSIENFKRDSDEQSYLFELLTGHYAQQLLKEFKALGVRVRFIGDRTLFPDSVRQTVEKAEAETEHLTVMTVCLLFCYGGQQEIVHSVNAIIADAQAGTIQAPISKETFERYLWLDTSIPAPDAIVRTGGIQRLSNFLLYQAAYSELFFLDCLWPDITEQHLTQVLESFLARKRNFGA